jgi:PAS domain S-box-containing protein
MQSTPRKKCHPASSACVPSKAFYAEDYAPVNSYPGHIVNLSMEQIELAAEAAGTGFWSLDLGGDVFVTNNKTREIFSFPDDMEITTQIFFDRVHPEDRAAVNDAIKRATEGENEVSVDYRITLPDGSFRWMHSRGRLQGGPQRESACLMGVTVNITDRKQIEESLSRQLGFESLLAEISAPFAKPTLSCDLDDLIRQALSRLAEHFDCDRCGLLKIDLENKTIRITHAFYREGIEKIPPDIELAPLFPWAFNEVKEGRCYYFSDPDELPPEAETDRRSWTGMGVKSALHLPLVVDASSAYLFAITSLTRNTRWPQEMLPRLKLVGELFMNAMYRRVAEEELRSSYNEIAQLKDKLEVEADYLRSEVRSFTSHERIIGQSEPIRMVLAMVEQVAPTSSTVLVNGETGTGKELIALAIHKHSPRRDRLMVKVNCASLPPSLVESELFGRERGAYTGALTRQIGRFELADNSTLFLDEISELSIELQAKLLRVLQEGEFERLGSPRTIKVNVRLIAATNRDLLQEVSSGRFREDLYYRLNVFPISIPPLRERLDDIPLLVWEFVRELNEKMGKRISRISKKEMSSLQAYSWPGNIRELRNVIEHAVIISTTDELKVKLPENSSSTLSPRVTLEEMERRYIADVIRQTGWRIKGDGGAAQILGMNPATLYSRMKKLDISSRHEKDGMSSSG